MDIERLTAMANQIARNLAARGEQAAAADTAGHIAEFWTPEMRAALLAEPAGLCPIARRAAGILAGGSAAA